MRREIPSYVFAGYPCTRHPAEKHREGHQGEAAVFPGEGLQRRAGCPDGERQRERHRAYHAGTEGNASVHKHRLSRRRRRANIRWREARTYVTRKEHAVYPVKIKHHHNLSNKSSGK